tara:strand:- start:388 stop:678 length:291 start_codon:yes stop_codon:yes gene_type:complete
MNYFNQIYRLMWFVLIILIMYLFFQDRTIELSDGSIQVISAFSSAPYLSITVIFLLIVLTSISVLRSIETRNEWRRIAEEDNVNKKIADIEEKKID